MTDPEKTDGRKAVLILAHFYLVAGEKKYAAKTIQEEFFMLIIIVRGPSLRLYLFFFYASLMDKDKHPNSAATFGRVLPFSHFMGILFDFYPNIQKVPISGG
jgi:hypothetical protein